jgi:hypothetical protein
MSHLTRSDLMSLECYANERHAFKARVLAHKKNRQVSLGPNISLLFEDRLTIQYQIQEMLRIERVFESAAIQDELDAYNPLIPDGSNLKATMLIEFPDVEQRKSELARLGKIEHAVYGQIEGFERHRAIADEDLERSNEAKTSAVHFMRFEFTSAEIMALRAGANLFFGIDDARLPIHVMVPIKVKESLSADFA